MKSTGKRNTGGKGEGPIKRTGPGIILFDYLDYRRYLADFYQFQKKSTRFFSYRYFSKKAGFASHNVLKQVILGQRNIAADSISRFSYALGHTPKEREYFRLLVLFGQAKTPAEKNAFFVKLSRARSGRKTCTLEALQLKLYSQWHHCAVREFVSCKGFDENNPVLYNHFSPPLTEAKIRESLELLASIGLIKRDRREKWVAGDAALKTSDEVVSQSVRAFNREMIKLGERAIDAFEPRSREISSMTFAITRSSFPRIKKMIQEFKNIVLSDITADEQQPEAVYQLNFQLFPLADTHLTSG